MSLAQRIAEAKQWTLVKQVEYMIEWSKSFPEHSPLTSDEWQELHDLLTSKKNDDERKRALIAKATA